MDSPSILSSDPPTVHNSLENNPDECTTRGRNSAHALSHGGDAVTASAFYKLASGFEKNRDGPAHKRLFRPCRDVI